MTQRRTSLFRHHQRGLSLVEIMVALLLGALITVGIVQMFTANRATYQINMGQARLQENARFAMEFVTSSMRMAGYRGCSNRTAVVNVLTGPPDLVESFNMDDAVVGHAWTGSDWSPTLDTLPADIDTNVVAEGSDVLIFRTVLDDGINFTGQTPPNSAQSFITLPLGCDAGETCPGYEPGTVILASDCLQTVVFLANGSTGQPNQNQMNLGHNTGYTSPTGLSNGVNPIDQAGADFNQDASVFRVGSEFFYIAPGAGTNNQGNAPLALFRKRGQDAPVELVEGVERLTALYGVDTSGDRVPNRYQQIHEVVNRANIVTIRVTIRVNSVNSVSDQGDGLLRRDFTKTVAIRNRV